MRLGSPRTRTAAALAVTLAAAPALAAQAPAPSPRPTLEALARQLEGAVSRVSPSAQSITGGPETTQALHMSGLGVVIVLPARALPQQRRQFALRPRLREQPPAPAAGTSASNETPGSAPAPARRVTVVPAPAAALEQLQRQLEQEMAIRVQLLEALERAQQGDDRLLQRALELHVLAIREQAEAFRIEVERARQRAENNLRVQIGTLQRPPSPPPPAATVTGEPAPDAPAAAGPAAPEPPWRAWVTTSQEMAHLNQAMVEQVREALVGALEAHGQELSGLDPEETVTVAVDFVGSPGAMALRPRVRGTLAVRALVRDVQARAAGQLSSADFRQRVQARLY